ncbi:hypothetical protein B0H14DRAFT_2578120 [Mycena olivaceomarginata]|nr:hypothetical protein B0H14DRAFT_2578120 [Mycena olivaceomarginata]
MRTEGRHTYDPANWRHQRWRRRRRRLILRRRRAAEDQQRFPLGEIVAGHEDRLCSAASYRIPTSLLAIWGSNAVAAKTTLDHDKHIGSRPTSPAPSWNFALPFLPCEETPYFFPSVAPIQYSSSGTTADFLRRPVPTLLRAHFEAGRDSTPMLPPPSNLGAGSPTKKRCVEPHTEEQEEEEAEVKPKNDASSPTWRDRKRKRRRSNPNPKRCCAESRICSIWRRWILTRMGVETTDDDERRRGDLVGQSTNAGPRATAKPWTIEASDQWEAGREESESEGSDTVSDPEAVPENESSKLFRPYERSRQPTKSPTSLRIEFCLAPLEKAGQVCGIGNRHVLSKDGHVKVENEIGTEAESGTEGNRKRRGTMFGEVNFRKACKQKHYPKVTPTPAQHQLFADTSIHLIRHLKFQGPSPALAEGDRVVALAGRHSGPRHARPVGVKVVPPGPDGAYKVKTDPEAKAKVVPPGDGAYKVKTDAEPRISGSATQALDPRSPVHFPAQRPCPGSWVKCTREYAGVWSRSTARCSPSPFLAMLPVLVKKTITVPMRFVTRDWHLGDSVRVRWGGYTGRRGLLCIWRRGVLTIFDHSRTNRQSASVVTSEAAAVGQHFSRAPCRPHRTPSPKRRLSHHVVDELKLMRTRPTYENIPVFVGNGLGIKTILKGLQGVVVGWHERRPALSDRRNFRKQGKQPKDDQAGILLTIRPTASSSMTSSRPVVDIPIEHVYHQLTISSMVHPSGYTALSIGAQQATRAVTPPPAPSDDSRWAPDDPWTWTNLGCGCAYHRLRVRHVNVQIIGVKQLTSRVSAKILSTGRAVRGKHNTLRINIEKQCVRPLRELDGRRLSLVQEPQRVVIIGVDVLKDQEPRWVLRSNNPIRHACTRSRDSICTYENNAKSFQSSGVESEKRVLE